MCVSDYWIGCDRTKALKLKVCCVAAAASARDSPRLSLQVGKLSKSERQKRAPEADDQGSVHSDGADGEGHSSESENEDAADDDDLTVRLLVVWSCARAL